MSWGKRLEAALDELRAAVFEAYAALAEEGAKTGTERQRRESTLQFIDEILELAPAGHVLGHSSRIARNAVRLLARDRGRRGCSSPGFAARSDPVAGACRPAASKLAA